MVGVERLVPGRLTVDGTRVRIEQQLVRIGARALVGGEGPVHAIAVTLAGRDVGDVAVPAERGLLGQDDALFLAVVVEEA